MTPDPRQWHFVKDMNNSGAVTITDVWLWVKWLYFYPGDFLIRSSVNTNIGKFLEITYEGYGGSLSGIISLVIWLIIIILIGSIFALYDYCDYQQKYKKASTWTPQS